MAGRYLFGGHYSAGTVSFARELGYAGISDGWTHHTRAADAEVAESGSTSGPDLRLAIVPSGRPRQATSYLHHNIGLRPDGTVSVNPLVIHNDYEPAAPVAADLTLPVTHLGHGLRPTELLWAARPSKAVFVLRPSFSDSPYWVLLRSQPVWRDRLRQVGDSWPGDRLAAFVGWRCGPGPTAGAPILRWQPSA